MTLTAASQLGQRSLDAALESAQHAQALATEIDDPDVLERAHLIASAVQRHKQQPDEAGREIERGIQALDRLRSDRTFGQRDEFFADDEGPWTAKAQLAFERGRIPDAFAAAEHLKVQRLRDAIGTDVCRGLTPEERGEERRLARAVVSVGRQLWRQRRQPNSDKARTASLESELLELAARRNTYDAVISAKHPELAVLRARVEPISLDAVRQLIPDVRTVILNFLVTEERTYLFLFAKDGTSTTTIEQPAAAITRLVTRFRELLRGPDSKPEEAARELYDLLIRPIAPWLQGRQRLVVVPDAVLWGLPFQALQPSSGRFLIQDYSVEYMPSLTALSALRGLESIRRLSTPAGETRSLRSEAQTPRRERRS